MIDAVEKNKFGYYTLKQIPSEEELQNYYANKYFQDSLSQYEKSYSADEIAYFQYLAAARFQIVQSLLGEQQKQFKFLDVGCGEGWTLQFFKNKGWDVLGLDYSSQGCKQHNPEMMEHLVVGDIYASIDKLIESDSKFDCIWLDNVLEHVIDPEGLLIKLKALAFDQNCVLVIDVPNEFSMIQMHLMEAGLVSKPYWIVAPDHISYFNKEGLLSLCGSVGWNSKYVMGDFPIDLLLLNEDTNYIEDKTKGKRAHLQRVTTNNLMYATSIEKTNELYRALSDLGLGRSIIGFFQAY